MKVRKIGLMDAVVLIVVLFVLSIPSYFLYSRFLLDKYEMDDLTLNTLRFKNSVYVRMHGDSPPPDTKNPGRTIGIAVYGKRTITDYIWPIWIAEYKNDKGHQRIFVRGLMDVGSVYEKTISIDTTLFN